jgi:hypothetical protein
MGGSSRLGPTACQAHATPDGCVTPNFVMVSGTRAYIADGDERREPVTAVVAGQAVTGMARRLVVRSRQRARAGEAALRARLANARAAVAALNDRGRGKRRFLERPALEEVAEAILMRYRIQGLLAVRSPEHVQERQLRRYGRRPATVGVERDLRVTAAVDRGAVAAERTVLAGLYVGNPKRATARPTTELLLKRFEGLPLTRVCGR